jgi:hypothetical protein
VAAEVERSSHIENLAGQEAGALDYTRAAAENVVEGGYVDGPPLRDEEKEAVGLLEKFGLECTSHDKDYLIFRQSPAKHPRLSSQSRRLLPRSYVRVLLGQVLEKVDDHPTVTGMMAPSRGYVELVCSRLSPVIAKRLFRLEVNEQPGCAHNDQTNALPSVPYRWPDEEGESIKRVHLSGREGEPCVEISNASPLAMLRYDRLSESGRMRLGYRTIPFLATLKMAYSHALPGDEMGRKSEETARSLIYELNVRNGVIIELDAPPAGPDMSLVRRPQEESRRIRYPRTDMQYEVSVLFGFASQPTDDLPQAFLSYYQALEYFIPAAIRQSAIKNIRRELRDPSFDDSNDASLLRIVKAAEGPIAAAEPNQLRIVVNEYVRVSRLEEFFDRGWGEYFSHRGPIKSVTPINIRNTNQTLPNQVADRVYQIRNRIVHAKDDPRFGGARVLLPRSTESNALTPDVLLVRLLATEAISAR